MKIGKIIGKTNRFLFTTNRAIWFHKRLSEKQQSCAAKISLTIERNNTEDVISWLRQQKESWVVSTQEIDTARTHHHVWLSAKYNKKIIGSIKIGINHIYIADFNQVLLFPNDFAFIYDTFVLEPYRNKGVARALIHEACKLMEENGFQQIGCHIPPWNTASIKTYENNGFEQLCFIRFIQIFGMQLMFRKSLCAQSGKQSKKLGKVTLPYESKNL